MSKSSQMDDFYFSIIQTSIVNKLRINHQNQKIIFFLNFLQFSDQNKPNLYFLPKNPKKRKLFKTRI